ncbi:MAG: hypothetical protein IPP41_07780 [Rhodocyclaceae bacterium]|nr:hypothetical protein [Rhodocyclaceae bacterium]
MWLRGGFPRAFQEVKRRQPGVAQAALLALVERDLPHWAWSLRSGDDAFSSDAGALPRANLERRRPSTRSLWYFWTYRATLP